MKFDDVLTIDTRVVDVARVRALVKNVHMMALKARLRAKKICARERVGVSRWGLSLEKGRNGALVDGWGERTARIKNSTILFVGERPMGVALAMALAHVAVSSVVVLVCAMFASVTVRKIR